VKKYITYRVLRSYSLTIILPLLLKGLFHEIDLDFTLIKKKIFLVYRVIQKGSGANYI
jgi:hypothetical protein